MDMDMYIKSLNFDLQNGGSYILKLNYPWSFIL